MLEASASEEPMIRFIARPIFARTTSGKRLVLLQDERVRYVEYADHGRVEVELIERPDLPRCLVPYAELTGSAP